MAISPDPNRNPETDREITPDELEDGGGMGNFSTSRLGLGTWATVILAVGFAALLLSYMLGG